MRRLRRAITIIKGLKVNKLSAYFRANYMQKARDRGRLN